MQLLSKPPPLLCQTCEYPASPVLRLKSENSLGELSQLGHEILTTTFSCSLHLPQERNHCHPSPAYQMERKGQWLTSASPF